MPTNLTTASLTQGSAPKPANAPARVEPRQSLSVEGQNAPAPEAVRTTEIGKAVSAINSYIQTLRRDLHFTIDEETDRTIIRVVDSETQEVIRQIPSEEVLALARSLEKSQGIILRAQA
ncbi:MAG: flagellar protein FlaG [Gammaproteobacteria bacterium]|nr:flagellar protein FlaG [Gammaproteobacteria bacterium]